MFEMWSIQFKLFEIGAYSSTNICILYIGLISIGEP